MKLLRFFTAGNVDDGKSTLIGRLLFDSNSISTDIIEALTRQTKVKGSDTDFDLALLTDGL
ncbi:MAG: GTP-binding protein, partial [Saprospiraceae bacterium]